MRYWYNEETDEYASSHTAVEGQRYEANGWRELDSIEFDEAMRGLK